MVTQNSILREEKVSLEAEAGTIEVIARMKHMEDQIR